MARCPLAVALLALAACQPPPEPPATPPAATVTPPVATMTRPPRARAPYEYREICWPAAESGEGRAVCELRSTLPPEIEGGWQGSPIVKVALAPLPAGWNGLVIQYYKSKRAELGWFLPYENYEVSNDDKKMIVATYLLWNSNTKEGIVVNPIKRDISFVVRAARAQPGIAWRYVVDNHTGFDDERALSGPRINHLEATLDVHAGSLFTMMDYDATLKEKKDEIAAAEVAAALGAEAVLTSLAEPRKTASGMLVIYKDGLPSPPWRYRHVRWGPFHLMGADNP